MDRSTQAAVHVATFDFVALLAMFARAARPVPASNHRTFITQNTRSRRAAQKQHQSSSGLAQSTALCDDDDDDIRSCATGAATFDISRVTTSIHQSCVVNRVNSERNCQTKTFDELRMQKRNGTRKFVTNKATN